MSKRMVVVRSAGAWCALSFTLLGAWVLALCAIDTARKIGARVSAWRTDRRVSDASLRQLCDDLAQRRS